MILSKMKANCNPKETPLISLLRLPHKVSLTVYLRSKLPIFSPLNHKKKEEKGDQTYSRQSIEAQNRQEEAIKETEYRGMAFIFILSFLSFSSKVNSLSPFPFKQPTTQETPIASPTQNPLSDNNTITGSHEPSLRRNHAEPRISRQPRSNAGQLLSAPPHKQSREPSCAPSISGRTQPNTRPEAP